jgi:hypothetical protein
MRTISAVGCDRPNANFPGGTEFTPLGDQVTARHAVAAYLPISNTHFAPLVLTECHWTFSREWVDRHGGLSKSHDDRYCFFCARSARSESGR